MFRGVKIHQGKTSTCKDWTGLEVELVAELSDNFQVRNCNNHACGSEPCYVHCVH